MTIESTKSMLADAVASGSAVCAFNVVHLETAEAFVEAAEVTGLPLVLQLSQNCIDFHGGIEPITRSLQALVAGSTANLALHLDHAEDVNLALTAIDLGFSSVMYDGAKLDFADNVSTTRMVREAADAANVLVEAELGEIGGKNGAHAPGVRTDPGEAARFVSETGVGALAVAVGSSHAMTERTASLDRQLIARLATEVPVPLVLHGSSGASDAMILEAIRAGIRKVNISTHLNAVFTEAVRSYLLSHPQVVDSRKYVGAGRDAIAKEAARLLNTFTGKGH